MSKLGRNEMPSGHSREDFECYGPVATKDTDFSNSKIADLGCFKQEGVDSNKYYHAAVCKSKKNGKWYFYVEYGRTKDGQSDRPQYQFTECESEADAQVAFAKQCAEKNTKRGQWEKVGSKERYVPKKKKDGSTEDLYVVRYMASRAVGLPAAKNICNQDAVAAAAPTTKTQATKTVKSTIDTHTRKLFRDLLGGAMTYTKSVMIGGTMPALSAIQDARDLLDDALKQLKVVGNKVEDQVKDGTLRQLTYSLYGMIPKTKAMGAAEKDWILSQENIGRWQDDLDAFETASKSGHVEEHQEGDDDVMKGIPAKVQWIDLQSEIGKFLANWWGATGGRGHGYNKLKVHNIWSVEREGDKSAFNTNLDSTLKEMPKTWNNERPQFVDKQKERPDLTGAERKNYWNANVGLLYHGSRTVNIPGIIRENFRFPKELKGTGVVINGAMFGGGVYSADSWSKSCQYCSSPGAYYAGDGGVSGRQSFMFACDVILGHPYVAPGAAGFNNAPDGHHCVFGKAGHTASWGGTLYNNEWIVYRKGRIQLRYLAEVSW